jgi:hypothetical protein
MTFPNNNLPTASRNWGREVEKKVTNLESSFRSAEVNNVTRDSQLSVTANTALSVAILAQDAAEEAQAAAAAAAAASTAASTANANAIAANTKALEALQDIVDLGSPGGPSISAANITAGTVNGLSITGGSLNTTAVGGKSVSISGSSASFQYNGSGVGSIEADTAGRLGVFASSGVYITGGSAGVGVFQGNLSCEFDAIVNNGLRLGGSAGSYFTRNGAGQMEGPGFRSTGNVNVAGNFFYDAPTATGTTYPLYINITTNQVYRLSSSARYKTAIQDAEFDYDKLLQAKVRTFKNKQEVEENGIENAELTYGYIAEELHELGLTDFVVYENDEDGNPSPESVNYMSMALATHEMLKVQDQKLKSLEARLEALESR